jgi:hypothetical protein
VEFGLARLNQFTRETVGEHPFFPRRVETVLGNLCRVRGQKLDTPGPPDLLAVFSIQLR